MKTHVIWLCVCIVAATIGISLAPGKIVTKEISKEVPTEVIKEVIKEVPKEVIKEVIKEVPAAQTIEMTHAKNLYEKFSKTTFVLDSDILKDFKEATVTIDIGDKKGLINDTIKEELKTQLELALRTSGIKVTKAGSPGGSIIGIQVDTMLNPEGTICYYTVRFSLIEKGYFPRDNYNRIDTVYGTTYNEMYYGYTARNNAATTIKSTLATLTNSFLNKYLEANPK